MFTFSFRNLGVSIENQLGESCNIAIEPVVFYHSVFCHYTHIISFSYISTDHDIRPR